MHIEPTGDEANTSGSSDLDLLATDSPTGMYSRCSVQMNNFLITEFNTNISDYIQSPTRGDDDEQLREHDAQDEHMETSPMILVSSSQGIQLLDA